MPCWYVLGTAASYMRLKGWLPTCAAQARGGCWYASDAQATPAARAETRGAYAWRRPPASRKRRRRIFHSRGARGVPGARSSRWWSRQKNHRPDE
eukprot:scaffold142726_cov32-Tisochrysis_lutea.AAC.2